MSKKIEVQLAELTVAVAELVTYLAPSAKALAQAPKASTKPKASKAEPKARKNRWDTMPGTTNSDAISTLQADGGTALTVTIEKELLSAVVGESYTNKAGALRRALWVTGLGFTTIRSPDGDLPKAGKVRFVVDPDEPSVLKHIEFSV